MDQNRRDFIKGASLVAAIAATGGLAVQNAEVLPLSRQAGAAWLGD